MGSTAVIAGTCGGFFGGAVVNGAVTAATGAASGAIGAAVLNSAGYAGYSVLEATQMGAAGNAVLWGSVGACGGAIVGALAGLGSVSGEKKSESSGGETCGKLIAAVATYTGAMTLGGLTGWGIFNAGANQSFMQLGQTAAALAVGGAISAIPAGVALLCVCLPVVCCGIAAVAVIDNDKDEAPDMRPSVSPV